MDKPALKGFDAPCLTPDAIRHPGLRETAGQAMSSVRRANPWRTGADGA